MPSYTITHIATTGDHAWRRVQSFGNRRLHGRRLDAEKECEAWPSYAADLPPELAKLDDFELMTLRVDQVPDNGGAVCPDGTVLANVPIEWTIGPGRMLIADGHNVATLVRSSAGPGPHAADLLTRHVVAALAWGRK